MRQRPFNCEDESALTWRQRAQVCAGLFHALGFSSETKFSVADVGCGDQKLRDAIGATGLRCDYHGYDLLPQGCEVECFDVRTMVLPRPHDVIVMLGVIEYLENLESVLASVAAQAPFFLVSHVIRINDDNGSARIAELGWRNYFSVDELRTLLVNSGFSVIGDRMTPDKRTLVLACRSRKYEVP